MKLVNKKKSKILQVCHYNCFNNQNTLVIFASFSSSYSHYHFSKSKPSLFCFFVFLFSNPWLKKKKTQQIKLKLEFKLFFPNYTNLKIKTKITNKFQNKSILTCARGTRKSC
jgi:hypothetical protein